MAKRNGTPNYALREARARGDKFYQPDFLCNNGHMTKRLTSSGACYECCKATAKINIKKIRTGPDGDAFRAKKREERARWKKNPGVAEKLREYSRKEMAKHRKKHPINARVDAANARAKKQGIEGRITVQEISEMLLAQDHKCAACAILFLENWDIDHIMPFRLRGLNNIGNIRILCRRCNRNKGYMHPSDWDRLRAGTL